MGLFAPISTTTAVMAPQGGVQETCGAMSNHRLTRREREVLRLVCLRLSDSEIADRLFIGTRTAESHVASILGKLGAANRREAASTASRLGLV